MDKLGVDLGVPAIYVEYVGGSNVFTPAHGYLAEEEGVGNTSMQMPFQCSQSCSTPKKGAGAEDASLAVWLEEIVLNANPGNLR